MVKNSILFIFILFLVSCEKSLDISLPFEKEKLVVFAQLTHNKPIKAKLSHTLNPNKTINFNLKPFNDVKILVYKGEVLFDSLKTIDNSNFIGNKNITQTDRYKIKIVSITWGNTESEFIYPIESDFEVNIKNKGPVISKLNPDTKSIRIEANIFSPVISKDYFRINIFLPNKNVFLTKSPVEQNESISNSCSFFLYDLSYIKKSNCVQDSFKISYDVELKYFDASLKKSLEPDSIMISVNKFDENFYEYLTTQSDNNFLENAFYTPHIFKSNFSNSIGIFFAIQEKSILLRKGIDY
jgi:hypothetical protein